jgi:hypothetical protein
LQALLREQLALQPEEPPRAMRLELTSRAAWEQSQGQLWVHFALERREPQREQRVSQRGQLAAQLALPQEQPVSQPH